MFTILQKKSGITVTLSMPIKFFKLLNKEIVNSFLVHF